MKLNKIKKICVVGAGNMGHQISMLAALHGFKVGCIDSSRDQLKNCEYCQITRT